MGFCFWNAAGRFELTASTCAKRVKSRGEAGFLRMAMPFAGCREASSSLVVYRTCALLLPCHSEPVLTLAWESASPVPCLSLWERWPSAARAERANKEGPPGSGPSFSLSINILRTISGSSTQGELERAKPASNQIKCRAKPCPARRAWSEATIFVPQGGTKITTLFQAVEKAGGFFDSLKRQERHTCRSCRLLSLSIIHRRFLRIHSAISTTGSAASAHPVEPRFSGVSGASSASHPA